MLQLSSHVFLKEWNWKCYKLYVVDAMIMLYDFKSCIISRPNLEMHEFYDNGIITNVKWSAILLFGVLKEM